MFKYLLTLLTACAVFAGGKSCAAATVALSGETLDMSPAIDATSASLGQTVLGTLFWDYENGSSTPNPPNDLAPRASRQLDDFVGNQRNNLPSYIMVGPGAVLQGASGGWNYQRILDDFGPSFESGTINASSTGSELLTLTIKSGTPAALRMGVLQDNINDVGFIGTDLTVEIGVSSASVNPKVNANRLGDIYWFDLTELAAGDVISIHSNGGGAGLASFVGGVIVSPVPEPAASSLLSLAVTAGVVFRRRFVRR